MINIPENELSLSFARSSGAGGQNVNKVNSKVILHWRFQDSLVLGPSARERFQRLFANAFNADGDVVIVSQESRSQKENVDACFEKLRAMIREARIVPKVRRKTKPTRGSVERRLTGKKHDSAKKRERTRKDW